MQVYNSIAEISARGPTGVTIGNFDGMHKGHQALVGRTLSLCREKGLLCVIITFHPHPRTVISPTKTHFPLTSLDTKFALLESAGVDIVLDLEFTSDMAALTPEEFVGNFLLPLSIRQLVIGHDFSLGRGRSGHAAVLSAIAQKHGFGLEQLNALFVSGQIVSSTRLREMIAQGDVQSAAVLLGRNYSFSGEVVHGDGRGGGLGFPTANLMPPENLLPATGVYATFVTVEGKKHQAVTNIGYKPTFGTNCLGVESFLLDVAPDLYGLKVDVEFVSRIRAEMHFASPKELVDQIGRDVELARLLLARKGS